MKYIIDEKDIEYIKLYPDDEGYNVFRNFKNAEIINQGTEEEFIVFYTLNKDKLQRYK
ncbi:TPA: hypothetical protein R1X69_001134 [Campylobacter upsaliensis]|uniref:hypothetical protein n=1 Tax=Campylobacter helveticus TaxID=28898 RepID=UPI00214AB401|nr:hypothetical protein [Campylobacter helveticus]MCR2060390.1 hypothetical protein [Campylobacter helveticus]HEC1573593.1 hypothetical protein [Campylobacter upsaliensis]